MAMLLSTAEGLRWLGRRKAEANLSRAGDAIEGAVKSLLSTGAPSRTTWLGKHRLHP